VTVCRSEGFLFDENIEGMTMVLHITPWERAALQLLANGTATNDIAGGPGTSECEVEASLTTLFKRMGATSRSEAVAAAFRRGLLTRDDQIHEVRASVPDVS
jgi:DNA-binding NarL/FixJ family response regulator